MTVIHHANRVFEVSTSSGTGNLLLGGAQAGYYTFFSSFGTSQTFAYVAANPITGENEVGTGTLHDNGDGTYSLVRGTVERSSNANALVNFSGGRLYIANPLLGSEADAIGTLVGTAVTAINPSVVDAVAVWDTTADHLRSAAVKILAGSNDLIQAASIWGALTTDADAATVTFNLNTSNNHLVTLGGNRTFAVSNARAGQRLLLTIGQDATGGRAVTWFSNIYWANGLAPVLDPTPAGVDEVELECIGVDAYSVPIWAEISRATSAPRKGITTATDGATVTFDLRKSPKQKVTLGGNRTLALQAGSYYVGQPFTLKLIQDGTGSRTVTWFSTINWAGGSAPTLTTTANKADWFGFICTDAAAPKFDGFVIGQGLAP